MKKIISILLVLVILISSVCSTSVFAAGFDDDDIYFEDNSRWIWSYSGVQKERKNIAVTQGEASTYATSAKNSNTAIVTTDSASNDNQSVKLSSYGHAYNIPLPDLEKNSTYSIEFSYKLGTLDNKNTEASNAFAAMGVYSPTFMDDKLTAAGTDTSKLSKLRFDNCTVGWAAVDRVIGGKYYRYRDDTLEKGAVTANRYYSETTGYTYKDLAGKWIKEKIVFSVKNYNDLHLVIVPQTTSGILLDDFKLEKNYDDYFENADNWILSLRGSETDRRNISVDGTVGINSSGHKGSSYFAVDNTVSLDGQGSSVKLNWATHPSNIALPDLENGKSYRLKFSFKVASNSNSVVANPQIKGIGIYSPKKMEDAITAGDNTSRFTDGTLGWNVFDSYNGTDGIKRYRDETLTSCAANKNSYATVAGDYTYNTANQWYTEELYFKVTKYTDLQLVIIPGDDNSGTFLDNFEFEMVEKVPDELIPGSTPNPGPEGPEDLNVIETLDSASIRAASEGSQGIRVNNRISKAEITKKNIVSYGAIAIRTKRMDTGVTLTLDTQNIATGIAYNTNPNFNELVTDPILRNPTGADTTNYNNFSCVLINIPQKYYGDTYSVRSFAIDKEGNVYYGEVIEVSVFDVVHAILKSDTASQNDKNTADSIVNEIIEANNTNDKIPTYAEWCYQNGFDDNSTAANNNQ